MTMPTASSNAFELLRTMILKHQSLLEITRDEPGHVYANSRVRGKKGEAQFFAAVKTSGAKHLFHFMPIYTFPALLDNLSPALKKRMQGKSCFNFEKLEQAIVEELDVLVSTGVERYAEAQLL